jgi:hypothetical protein
VKRDGPGEAEPPGWQGTRGIAGRLRIGRTSADGLQRGTAQGQVRLAPLWRQPLRLQSSVVVLGDTWDHRTLGFRRLQHFQFDERLRRLPDLGSLMGSFLAELPGVTASGREQADEQRRKLASKTDSLQQAKDKLNRLSEDAEDSDTLEEMAKEHGTTPEKLEEGLKKGNDASKRLDEQLKRLGR